MRNKIIFLFLLLMLSNQIFGHDNEIVHPDILTGQAVCLTTSTLAGYEELNDYYRRYGVKNDIREGTIEADEPVTKCFNHFYNPVTYEGGSGIFGGNDAISYGKTFWETAITDYNDGSDESKQTSYRNLGNVLHLLQDI